MKTDYWAETVTRPEVNGIKAILAYEIYGKPTKITERQTVAALNKLVELGEAKFVWSKNFVWYVKTG